MKLSDPKILILVRVLALVWLAPTVHARPMADSLPLPPDLDVSKNGSLSLRLHAGPTKRPPEPYIQRLDGDAPILKFFSYGRDFPSDLSPQHTELQAFRYVEYMLDTQGLDIRVHVPPGRLSFSYEDALLVINVFEPMSYFDLSDSLRALGWFHLRFGYFEKKFILSEPTRQGVLCTGRMVLAGARLATE